MKYNSDILGKYPMLGDVKFDHNMTNAESNYTIARIQHILRHYTAPSWRIYDLPPKSKRLIYEGVVFTAPNDPLPNLAGVLAAAEAACIYSDLCHDMMHLDGRLMGSVWNDLTVGDETCLCPDLEGVGMHRLGRDEPARQEDGTWYVRCLNYVGVMTDAGLLSMEDAMVVVDEYGLEGRIKADSYTLAGACVNFMARKIQEDTNEAWDATGRVEPPEYCFSIEKLLENAGSGRIDMA